VWLVNQESVAWNNGLPQRRLRRQWPKMAAMKIQLLSDLHLETDPDFLARPAPGADLLVLAGDIGSYRRGSLMTGDDFGLGSYAPSKGWPTPVVYVPGNHEYDNVDFDETHARLRQLCGELGIHWLERETLVIDGVRFVGTTLWTDFDALAAPGDTVGAALKKREKAFRAADFYLEKAEMRRRCASRGCYASNGCKTPCARPTTGRPWPSPTSPPPWRARIRVTASPPAQQGSAMRWTPCCPWPTSGCTAISTVRRTM
jgi:hypothetical protein